MVQRGAPRYVPPGWPPEVNPPGSEDWETTAAVWLLDLVPEYRQHAAVRRHPVILAFIARHVIASAVEGARQGYRALPFTSRTSVAACLVFSVALRVGHDRGWRPDAAVNATRPLL